MSKNDVFNVSMGVEKDRMTKGGGAHVYEGNPDARLDVTGMVTPTRFRPVYRILTPEEKALHDEIKCKAEELEALFNKVGPSGRYHSLALTSLEQSIMWIVKQLTA